jgi:putative copper resistance protein D
MLPVARTAARRLSALGIASIACLAVTGVVAGVNLSGGPAALLGTPYGRLLTAKLLLFALMVAFAAANRRRWTPMLEAADATGDAGAAAAAVRRLRRNTICETALAVAIVAIVGALGALSPGAHDEIVWPLPFTLAWPDHGDAGIARAAFAVSALVAGALLAIARRRRGAARASAIGIGVAAVGALSLLVVPAYPTTYSISPVRYTAASIARGSALYAQHCAHCHGPYGYGDGAGAAALPVAPAPLTRRLLGRREGDLFGALADGTAGSAMPGFSESLGDSQRWDIVNFLLAQAEAEAAKTMDGSVEPWRGTVAPDFAFETTRGRQETLRQQRGRTHVLLVLFTYPDSASRLCILADAKERLAAAGIRVLAVPIAHYETSGGGAGVEPRCVRAIVAADADSDIAAAYTLFRRIPPRAVPPIPAHAEFLIDRQGYLRARWIARAGYAWDGESDLVRQVRAMERRQPRPDAPERPGVASPRHPH